MPKKKKNGVKIYEIRAMLGVKAGLMWLRAPTLGSERPKCEASFCPLLLCH